MSEIFSCVNQALSQAGAKLSPIKPGTELDTTPHAESANDPSTGNTVITLRWTDEHDKAASAVLAKRPGLTSPDTTTYGLILVSPSIHVTIVEARPGDVHSSVPSDDRVISYNTSNNEQTADSAPARPEKLPEAVSDAIACFAKS